MMIPPETHESLGSLLREALVQFKTNTALIEVNRKKEVARFSYREFREVAEPLALRLEETGIEAGSRVAIIMGNQSKWLLSAYACFFRGAILIPVDYKLNGEEQATLVRHAKADLVITEYPAWRQLGDIGDTKTWVTEAPADHDLEGAERWETPAQGQGLPTFVPRKRTDVATIVYSSGTGGLVKGCMLTHEAYLEQLRSLTALFPLETGDRYFSILPTNHAIDFMCGFAGPLSGGACVVHQRALRPEFIRHTMRTQKVTHMAVVPLILEAFERTIREKLDELSTPARAAFEAIRRMNAKVTERRPNHALSSRLLKPVHDAFGGHLKLLFCGGAFVDRARAEFFYELGLPVVIGYGLTEACTVLTVNDLMPFRGDSVGRPVDGVELTIRNANPETGVGEVWARSKTLMSGYLDAPELTADSLVDGWLRTGDLGWLDAANHLHLVGRSKNMIVTAGGKNVYPEDIEAAFDGLPCEELVVYASGYLWPDTPLGAEALIAVAHDVDEERFVSELRDRNLRLPDYKRISGLLLSESPFPRTASMKVKRIALAETLREAASSHDLKSLRA